MPIPSPHRPGVDYEESPVANPSKLTWARLGSCRNDVYMWVTVAACFVIAATKAGSAAAITRERFTVPGLEKFLLEAVGEGFGPADIRRLFDGKRHLVTRRPRVLELDQMSLDMRELLMQMTEEDEGSFEEEPEDSTPTRSQNLLAACGLPGSGAHRRTRRSRESDSRTND